MIRGKNLILKSISRGVQIISFIGGISNLSVANLFAKNCFFCTGGIF